MHRSDENRQEGRGTKPRIKLFQHKPQSVRPSCPGELLEHLSGAHPVLLTPHLDTLYRIEEEDLCGKTRS